LPEAIRAGIMTMVKADLGTTVDEPGTPNRGNHGPRGGTRLLPLNADKHAPTI
jgi:hypothetical protein